MGNIAYVETEFKYKKVCLEIFKRSNVFNEFLSYAPSLIDNFSRRFGRRLQRHSWLRLKINNQRLSFYIINFFKVCYGYKYKILRTEIENFTLEDWDSSKHVLKTLSTKKKKGTK